VNRVLIWSLLAGSIWFAGSASAENWYQFRGPQGNGISSDASVPESWSPSAGVRWKTSIPGEGWAAPVVVGGKVILCTAVSEGRKDPGSTHRWQVICLDEKTGEVLWTQTAKEAKPSLRTHRDNTYATETPVTDGERVIAYFGMTGLYCYDLDGKPLWSKDLGSFPMRNDWGTSSSPVIADGSVILQIDNEQASFIVALDAETGEERWRRQRQESSNWGSPVVWTNSLRSEVITSGKTIRSYDPASGDLLWELNFGLSGISSSPVGSGDLLVVGHAGRNGAGMMAVKAGGSGDISLTNGQTSNEWVAWSLKEGPGRASPLVYDGYVYLLGGRGGMLTCLDAQTGEVAYRERLRGAGAFWASPWVSGGKLFCPDEAGKTFVLQPGPEFKLLATNELPADRNDRFWATAAIGDGTLFVRSSSAVYAIGEDK